MALVLKSGSGERLPPHLYKCGGARGFRKEFARGYVARRNGLAGKLRFLARIRYYWIHNYRLDSNRAFLRNMV